MKGRLINMSIYEISALKKDGTQVKLSEFKGKVMLIVNSATHCGFTPHYKNFADYHNAYADKGLEVLDFPCNQFGEQTKGNDEEIASFCMLNYNTPYELYAKIEVNGENQTELFKYLKEGFKKVCPESDDNTDIKWNFTKFLVDREGNIVKRFEPRDSMDELEEAIKALL